MIRIAITQAAFEAIAATLPVGAVGYENATNEKGPKKFPRERFALRDRRPLHPQWPSVRSQRTVGSDRLGGPGRRSGFGRTWSPG